MTTIQKNEKKLILKYVSDYAPADWMKDNLENEEEFTFKSVFNLHKEILEKHISEEDIDEDEFQFVIGKLEDGYYKIDKDVLGLEGYGSNLLDKILDCGRAGLSAEMLGTGAQAFDMTLEYLKTREQFGRVIGSFQALGHRAADLFGKMELSRSCMEAALQSLDNGGENSAEMVSLSKARVGDFLYEMSNQLIQIHGGIGMTDEFDAGFYLKRARVMEASFGNRAFHKDRYAKLLGF